MAGFQTKTFYIDEGSVGNYSYYQLDITDIWDTVSANSVQLAEIELYECTEEDCGEGQNWNVWSDASNPDISFPWSWDFDFPNGTGYYEFYSIGKHNGDVEEAPLIADARCYYNPP